MFNKVMFVIICKGQEDKNIGQFGGCICILGVGLQYMLVIKIWFGKVFNDLGYCFYLYYYGEVEIGGYVLKGKVCIYFGENWQEYFDMEEGDFIFVLFYWLYIEVNMLMMEELVWMIMCMLDNIVINLLDVDDFIFVGFWCV